MYPYLNTGSNTFITSQVFSLGPVRLIPYSSSVNGCLFWVAEDCLQCLVESKLEALLYMTEAKLKSENS
jgi:hypothetical protein